jgi:sulfate adenylyltransferase/3'-phosphoadenosine 5'-phosphosulfate synthase
MSGFIVWFTGLSGAGKSTLANKLVGELKERGVRNVEVLDGDEVRTHLSKGLGFSREDRATNIDRIGYVARRLAENGTVAITAAISPYTADRDAVRAQSKAPFIEVHVAAELGVLAGRDPKGLYKRALAGEIPHFTGVSDPYEAPAHPEVRVDTGTETVDQSTKKIIDYLVQQNLISDAGKRMMKAHGGKLVDRIVKPERVKALTDEARSLRKIELSRRELSDLLLIGEGALSPLEGFQGPNEVKSVVERGRLPNGLAWTIPITLVDKGLGAKKGERIALFDHDGALRAVLTVSATFKMDLRQVAEKVYGTTDEKHPGVQALMNEGEDRIAGTVEVLPFQREDPRILSPRQVRAELKKRGWRDIVDFQTRNPLHRSHEHLIRTALDIADGVLLQPLVGETKSDDIPGDVRMKCYEALIKNYFPADRIILAPIDVTMRYAGPAEAIHHAILRQNYGATRMIVGRDHAGVGKFYGPFDAQKRFERYDSDSLAIQSMPMDVTFWCTACGGTASEHSCGHGPENRLELSGSEVRRRLTAGEPLPSEFTRPEVEEILRAYYQSKNAQAVAHRPFDREPRPEARA